MSAGIYNVQTKTIGAINGLPTTGNTIDDVAFFRCDGTAADWSSNVPTQIKATIASGGAVSFTENKQYYPTKADESAFLIGFHPQSTIKEVTKGSIAFEASKLTGQEDIMYAPVKSGSKATTTALEPAFAHQLSQLQFKFIKDASFISTATVASVVVKGTHLPESMAINDGTITYSTTASSITAFTNKTYAIQEEPSASNCGSVVMVEAVPTAGKDLTLKLDITLSDGTVISDVAVNTLQKPEIGKAHVITLTFKQKEVTASATIAQWDNSSTNGTGEVL